jgi:hypothetical protein
MDKYIKAITDWPIIVQAVFGSAIFWALSSLGERSFASVSSRVAQLSSSRKSDRLKDELFRALAYQAAETGVDSMQYSGLLWYRASRYLIKALIFLTLGLISESIFSVFGIAGYIGSLFYLFDALRVVGPVNPPPDLAAHIAEIQRQLTALGGK